MNVKKQKNKIGFFLNSVNHKKQKNKETLDARMIYARTVMFYSYGTFAWIRNLKLSKVIKQSERFN